MTDTPSDHMQKALSAIVHARRILVDHLRQMAAGAEPYAPLRAMPEHYRDIWLAAADVIDEDGRRLN